jgi:hypothetical protein
MTSYINIQPKDITQTVSKILIKVSNLELNSYAIIKVQTYDSSEKMITSESFVLSGTEYDMWSTDNYLIEYVCNKYNYTLA